MSTIKEFISVMLDIIAALIIGLVQLVSYLFTHFFKNKKSDDRLQK